jgi:hypothetical protein
MRKLLTLASLALFIFSVRVFAQHFWRGELMPPPRVEKQWGHAKFDSLKFKIGDTAVRASMAFDLINSKSYVGKSRLTVIKELGPSDGYYFSGLIPAYLINNPPKKGDDVWQIVFLLNKNGVVSKVVVHKNCCDK